MDVALQIRPCPAHRTEVVFARESLTSAFRKQNKGEKNEIGIHEQSDGK
jgi:hypothetical protein